MGKYLRHPFKKTKIPPKQVVKVIALTTCFGGQFLNDSFVYYKQLNVLKIEELYTLEEAKLMHKFYRNKLPNRFSSFYSDKCDTHTNHLFGILQPKSLYSIISNCKDSLNFRELAFGIPYLEMKILSFNSFKINLNNT